MEGGPRPTPSISRLGGLRGAIDGELILPEDGSYEDARRIWNGRFEEVRPRAVARCRTATDVAAAVAFAVREHLPRAVRAGGHDFAGHSTTAGLLIDVGAMGGVEVGGGVVRTGPGARLGDVYRALDPHGLTLPGGTCPQVAIAGLALGGGLGILGRSHGLLADRMLAAEIVLADGRILACDEHHHEDLFWALRGAGAGRFGVVTQLTFAAVPAPDRAVDLHVTWPIRDMPRLIAAWQRWAPGAPDALAASLNLTVPGTPGEPAHADLYATHLGTEEDAEQELRALIARAGVEPATVTITPADYPQVRAFWATLDPPGGGGPDTTEVSRRDRVFAKSEYFRRPLDGETIEALLAATLRERTTGQSRELDFMPWRGAYAHRRPHETAFVHRDEDFLLKYSTSIALEASPAARTDAAERVEAMWAATLALGSGRSFQNFADPRLGSWAVAYHGENLPRLRRVKARYDPQDVFAFDRPMRAGGGERTSGRPA